MPPTISVLPDACSFSTAQFAARCPFLESEHWAVCTPPSKALHLLLSKKMSVPNPFHSVRPGCTLKGRPMAFERASAVSCTSAINSSKPTISGPFSATTLAKPARSLFFQWTFHSINFVDTLAFADVGWPVADGRASSAWQEKLQDEPDQRPKSALEPKQHLTYGQVAHGFPPSGVQPPGAEEEEAEEAEPRAVCSSTCSVARRLPEPMLQLPPLAEQPSSAALANEGPARSNSAARRNGTERRDIACARQRASRRKRVT
mmetsp:Transcript_106736/g.340783  ORF Transcript_106736/g.340783 Transcript_106736/m.340783 type:complete len:260 (-) Transcript_106736:10-789(-)